MDSAQVSERYVNNASVTNLELKNYKVLSGVEAASEACLVAGVKLVSGYPGTPTTGVLEHCARHDEMRCHWAQNEKVAMEIGIGAAHAGARALVTMKHVGLNVAADPFFSVAYTGLEGGLVVLVGDDPGAKSSQNEQDTRQVSLAAGVPVLEPSDVSEIFHYIVIAFELSERYDLPIVVRVNSRLCFSREKIALPKSFKSDRELGFAKPYNKYTLLPGFVQNLHRKRNRQLASVVSDELVCQTYKAHLPQVHQEKYSTGIIVAGDIAQVVRETLGEKFPILIVGFVYPVVESEIRIFSEKCRRIVVAEESSAFLDSQIRSIGIQTETKTKFDGVGEFNIRDLYTKDNHEFNDILDSLCVDILPAMKIDGRPSGFCAGCSHTGPFHVLKELGLYVVGDIGCNTMGALEPFNSLHANLCMGASIGILQGYLSVMEEGANENVVAVLGDSTFFHSGMSPLLTLVNQKSQGTVIILDNSGSAMTGLQKTNVRFDEQGWRDLLQSFGVQDIHIVDALDLQGIKEAVSASISKKILSVCVLLGECAFTHVATPYRYEINESLCTQCNKCVETNCPSFSVIDNQPGITDACVGCGYCSQVCPEGAIMPHIVNGVVKNNKTLSKVVSKIPWHSSIRRARNFRVVDFVFDKLEKKLIKRAEKNISKNNG